MKKKMMKKVVSFALAMVMVLTSVLIGGVEVKAAEKEWEATTKIVNDDFEDGEWAYTGWTVTSGDSALTYSVKDGTGTNNATRIFNIYNGNSAATSFSMTQTIEGLEAGTYKLAFQQEGADSVSGLSIAVGGTTKTLPATTGWDVWATIETDEFTLVEAADVTITISGSVAAGYWGDFDNFVLYKEKAPTVTWSDSTKIVNDDFEDGEWAYTGWTVTSGDSALTYAVKDGTGTNNATRIFNIYNGNSAATSFSMTQTITGLEAGTYKLSLQQEGAAGTSGLSVKISGTTVNVSKTLPATTGWDVWATVETDEFTLASAEDVTITISGDVAAGYWGDFDNVVLYKADESGSTTTPEGGNTTNPEGGSTTNPEGGSTTTPEGGSTTTPEGGNTTTSDDKNTTEEEKVVVFNVPLENATFTEEITDDGAWKGDTKSDKYTEVGNKYVSITYASNDWLQKPAGAGTHCLQFDVAHADEVTIYQWVKDLKAGTYSFTMPIMGENIDVYFVLGDKTVKATSLAGGNNWITAKGTITLTEDIASEKVGFKLVATGATTADYNWGYIDSITVKGGVPDTGDTTNVYAYVLLMMAGLAIVGYSVKRNKVEF